MLRPARTVRVTSKEEFDAALAATDQIIVEGDDELLTYAINKASNDGLGNRVTVELGRSGQFVIPEEVARLAEPRIPAGPTEGGGAAPPREARAATRRPSPVIIAAALVAFLVIAGAIGWYLWLGHSAPTPPSANPAPPLAEAPAPMPPLPVPDVESKPPAEAPVPHPPPSDWGESLSSLLWPLVAIIAIVALFLIARQAISSGSNVTIVWKVTEKVSGRVVITKVRERASKRRAAA